jgi:general secretion pathway protein G
MSLRLHPESAGARARRHGFTLIEMVVVLAVLGLLLSIAIPRYLDSLDRGREHVLAHNLAQMREAIDRYYGDRGAYPDSLADLVDKRYLRAVPLNPFTETADWQTIVPPSGQKGRVYDVAAPAGTVPTRDQPAAEAPVGAASGAGP